MTDFRDLFAQASTLLSQGQPLQAMPLFDKILLERPDFTPAWCSRGAALQKLGDSFDAIMCYNKAIDLAPHEAGYYYNNRGAAYMDLERFDEAICDFKMARIRNPEIAEIDNNTGNTLMQLRRPAEALEYYRQAVKKRSTYADAHIGVGMAALMLGQYEEGFKEFEWRWQTGQMKSRGLTYKVWEGEPAENKDDILLFYGEQGMGDVLQFCRFAPLLKAKWGGKIWVECVHPLVRLLSNLDGIDGISALGEKLPEGIKYCIAMISACRVLGTTLETVPNKVPYLKYDAHRAGIWRERLKVLPPGLRVGVCWAGMNRDKDRVASSIDARRSMDLSLFKPLGGIPGVFWVSLQMGPPKEQLQNNPAGMICYDGTNDIYDFFDTAALVACLDLVITVDTSVAHVAGALAKPTWLLSRYDACWRWLMDRDDTPWYPTMRLFTQRTRHDWPEVINRVHVELLKLANEHRLRAAA
jgi:Tfp pilus assembly protein PilF